MANDEPVKCKRLTDEELREMNADAIRWGKLTVKPEVISSMATELLELRARIRLCIVAHGYCVNCNGRTCRT